jgi:hypothetical protein
MPAAAAVKQQQQQLQQWNHAPVTCRKHRCKTKPISAALHHVLFKIVYITPAIVCCAGQPLHATHNAQSSSIAAA